MFWNNNVQQEGYGLIQKHRDFLTVITTKMQQYTQEIKALRKQPSPDTSAAIAALNKKIDMCQPALQQTQNDLNDLEQHMHTTTNSISCSSG